MKKDVSKTLTSFLLYLYLPTLVILIGNYVFKLHFDSSNLEQLAWLNIIFDLFYFVFFIIYSIDIFKEYKVLEGKDSNEKTGYFISSLVKATVGFFVVKILGAFIVGIISTSLGIDATSANQAALEEIINVSPLWMLITSVICAPVVEELLFRGAIRRIIKNKRVFVIVSGLSFGLVHVLKYNVAVILILVTGLLIDKIYESELKKNKKVKLSILTFVVMFVVYLLSLQFITGNLLMAITSIEISELISGVLYVSVGLFLAYIFQKYNNIYLNIGTHMINNLFSYIIIYLIG
jgi:membrane protease YdiL (CAAX protease family)